MLFGENRLAKLSIASKIDSDGEYNLPMKAQFLKPILSQIAQLANLQSHANSMW